MRTKNKLAAFMVGLFGVCAAPSAVRAEDDASYDAKGYTGAMCDSVVSTVASVRTDGFYANTSGSTASVICPVIQDSWQNLAGLSYSHINFSNAGGTFSCTESSFDTLGTLQSSRSFSTTSVGLQRQYFYTGSFLPTTAAEGYITIFCSVPKNSQIKGYLVQEKP